MDMPRMALYITVFLFGITVGSFLNVCILRIPRGESVVTEPSRCPRCHKRLRWFELIPLVSWLLQRGRCRRCGESISAQYPLIEAANGVLWILVCAVSGFTPDAPLRCLTASALLALAVVDGRTGEIPPAFPVFILCLGLARLLLAPEAWAERLLGLAAVSLPLLLILLLSGGRGIGGGDVKLMAACGLFLGWRLAVFAFLLGCVLGSVIHLIRMRFAGAGRTLALGPYLSAGVFVSMLWGETLLSWYLRLYL
jgi:leader peptidase (prepilin peptidase)/N-methyltransferase